MKNDTLSVKVLDIQRDCLKLIDDDIELPYNFDDPMPYGHGEKSVYIINGYMRLSREEAFAIRYHMGFSGNEDKNSVGKAFEMFPLAFALSVADMEATYFLEGEPKEDN